MCSKNILSLDSSLEIKPLSEIKAEETPLEITFTDTVVFEQAKPERECFYSIPVNDSVKDDGFSVDNNHCFGWEASEHPDWPIGHRFSNQSHSLSQVEVNYMNDSPQPLRGLS